MALAMTATIASPGPSSGTSTGSTCRLVRGSLSRLARPANIPISSLCTVTARYFAGSSSAPKVSGDRSPETFGALALPAKYRAVTVHKDEIGMFAGLASRDKDPRTSLHVEQVEVPELGPGEAIVAVMASAINYNTVW